MRLRRPGSGHAVRRSGAIVRLGLLVSLLPGLAGVLETPPTVEDVELAAGERERLQEGGVLVEPREPTGGSGVALRAVGVVDAPPAAVWPVIRDCEHYARFLPNTTESELLGRREGSARCRAVIDLPWPLGELRSVVRTREAPVPGGGFRRRWSLIEGDYERLEGRWTLRPWGDSGEATLAIYEVDFDPNLMIPDFLLRRTQHSTAPAVLRSIRERVEALKGNASGAPG